MEKRDLVERLLDDAQGEDLGADGVGWSPDPALKREAADELMRLRAESAALKREAHTWSKAAEHYAKPMQPLDPLDVEELWDLANADPYADEVHQEFARLIQRKLGIGG